MHGTFTSTTSPATTQSAAASPPNAGTKTDAVVRAMIHPLGFANWNSTASPKPIGRARVPVVLGASAWLSDGTLVEFGPEAQLAGRAARIAAFVRELALRHRAEIRARWPKVMRRVGGYNLDIFDNQSERPYTGDGSVNLAHLLIGSEGTLACTRSLTLRLSELLFDETAAQAMQLGIEYDPQPPFDSGHPDKASVAVKERLAEYTAKKD